MMEEPLPSNVEAEFAVVAACLVDDRQISNVAEIINDNDFYNTECRNIFKAIKWLADGGKPIDLPNVYEQLKGVVSAHRLAEIINMIVVCESAQSYAGIVKDKSVRRALITNAHKIIHQATSAETAAIAVEQSQTMINGVFVNTTGAATPYRDICLASFDRYEKARKNAGKITGMPTGYRHLDWMLCGLQPGDLIILAARPSMGKSALAANVSLNQGRQGIGGAVFSLEMMKEKWFDRNVASRTSIPAMKFRNGMFGPEEWQLLTEKADEFYKLPIWIDDTGGLDVGEICRRAKALVALNGVKMVIIDHLQIMLGNSAAKTRDREIGEITRRLKTLAKEIKCPVMLLSQLNRNLEQRENKRPVLADLRDSGNIEQDADVVLFLYREAYYLEKQKAHIDSAGNETAHYQKVKNLAELDIAKQREGPIGTVPLFWNEKITTFSEMQKST